MKFKLDENIPVEASILLRESGHDAVTVLDQNMGGKADEHIIQACTQEQRALQSAARMAYMRNQT